MGFSCTGRDGARWYDLHWRISRDQSALLLVQYIQEFRDALERLFVRLAGVDHTVAIALQRLSARRATATKAKKRA